MTRTQRADYNRFARDFLTFNLNLDNLTGRKVSLDVWPYSAFRPKAVAKLIGEFVPTAPSVTPLDRPCFPKQRRRRATPTATAAVNQPRPMAPVVDFVPDDVDDLWR